MRKGSWLQNFRKIYNIFENIIMYGVNPWAKVQFLAKGSMERELEVLGQYSW